MVTLVSEPAPVPLASVFIVTTTRRVGWAAPTLASVNVYVERSASSSGTSPTKDASRGREPNPKPIRLLIRNIAARGLMTRCAGRIIAGGGKWSLGGI